MAYLIDVNLEKDGVGITSRKLLDVRPDHLAGAAPRRRMVGNNQLASSLRVSAS